MIIKLDQSYHERLMEYIKKEPEINLFIIGDIENYGYDNYFLTVWGEVDRRGNIIGVLLKYFNHIIFYSRDKYDLKGFYNIIKELEFDEISGEKSIIEPFKNMFKFKKTRDAFFCKMDSDKNLKGFEENKNIKKIKFNNLNKISKLYSDIDEFDNMSIEAIKTGLKSGRGYCIEQDGKIIAMAKSTAENSCSAMIVGVGTHPEYRNKGYATSCMAVLCRELLNENKTLCLFYDNPKAGRIYKKLGFKDIGIWRMYSL